MGKRTGTITSLNQSMPYAAVIGLENVEDEAGLLSVLRYKPSNIGNTQIPALHGGVVGAFLEHAAILHRLHGGEVTPFPRSSTSLSTT